MKACEVFKVEITLPNGEVIEQGFIQEADTGLYFSVDASYLEQEAGDVESPYGNGTVEWVENEGEYKSTSADLREEQKPVSQKDKSKLTVDLIALQAASEAFGERLPDNWEEMNEESQNEFLDENRFGRESLSTDEFFSLIDCHSDTVKLAIWKSLDLLKEKLVNAAIEDSLPSDFNELDLQSMLGMR